ncbi:hypothetical protein PRH55_003605 [Morganella morganii]|uniref:hypothetical protein n=1 Tax=Morganella morganii TaxID=582 RepID=UPI00280E1570|nr:hypothetical protein [Morganella morganii]ELB1016408.1 hypothetical protein [Morganella morganii]
MKKEKYYPFSFNMSKEIPEPVARELVAIKQVLMTILAKNHETRQEVVKDLSAVDSPIMQDIVKNIKLIDQ